MAENIFFSWQSDTQAKAGRTFIEEALKEALKNLSSNAEIVEALRGEELALDKDTKGVAGTPPIVDTIFRKITAASVFLADLTFVSSRSNNVPSPNPNVLIEYGWALNALGHYRMMAVMNTAYGKPSPTTMPFDLRNLRNPVCYHLSDGASKADREVEKKKLVSILEDALKAFITSGAFTKNQPEQVPFAMAEAKSSPSSFLAQGEKLGDFRGMFPEDGETTVSLGNESRIYIRVMPTHKQKAKLTPLKLREEATRQPHGLRTMRNYTSGGDWDSNKYGFVVVDGNPKSTGVAHNIVQIFNTGEIWAINGSVLYTTQKGEKTPLPSDFEEMTAKAVQHYRDFLISLGIQGPFKWIVGVTDVNGRQIAPPPAPQGRQWVGIQKLWGKCNQDTIEGAGEIQDDSDVFAKMLPFFEEVWETFEVKRPSVLRKSFSDNNR